MATSTTSTGRPSTRRWLGVAAGKATRQAVRSLGRGGGTSLPGLIAQKIDPRIVSEMTAEIPGGVVVVSGTNGKTTTARMIQAMLSAAGLMPIHNREGSNLERGLATTLLANSDYRGRLRGGARSIGLFEIDEGILPPFLDQVTPKVIVLTNILRDQLDRYLELDYLAELWRRRLVKLPPKTVVVLNADDPLIAELGSQLDSVRRVYFGLADVSVAQTELEHASDSRRCLRCSTDFEYTETFYGHLGHYRCPGCGWTRPEPDIKAISMTLNGLESSTVDIETPTESLTVEVPLPGLFNIYNAVAAIAAVTAMDLSPSVLAPAISRVAGAFGRVERVQVDGRELIIMLVKNPSGYNQVLRVVKGSSGPKTLMLALNDNQMDGRDVSWIWDVDFEMLEVPDRTVVVSGLRAYDLALRLKHAGWFPHQESKPEDCLIETDVIRALDLAIQRTPVGESVYLLTTYTPMWELREHLRKRGLVGNFYE